MTSPHDCNAEWSLLAVATHRREMLNIVAALPPEMFYLDAHRVLHDVLREVKARDLPLDLVTLVQRAEAHPNRGALAALPGGLSGILPDLMSAPSVPENVGRYIEQLQRCGGLRRLHEAGQRAQAASLEPDADLAKIEAELRGAMYAKASGAIIGRFTDAAVTSSDLCATDIPKPRSILGDNVLVEAGLAVFYGQPEIGKTWQSLARALAFARGEPWVGLATPKGGIRVGLLELELRDYRVQQRVLTLGGGHENFRIVCRPMMSGAVDLCNDDDMTALRHWIEHDRLEVLEIDALSRAHTASEGKAEELGPLLGRLDALRHDTGCALILTHHERKTQGGNRNDSDLDALRGHSRLQSDPTLLVRVKRVGEVRCVTFVKVSEAAAPAPVYFRIGEQGRLEIVNSPDAPTRGDRGTAKASRARVKRAVADAGRQISRGEVVEATKLSEATVKRHLDALVHDAEITKSGSSKNTRYSATTGSSDPPAHHSTRAGAPGLSCNDFGRSHTLTGSRTGSESESSPAHRLTGSPLKGEPGGEPVESGDRSLGSEPSSRSARRGFEESDENRVIPDHLGLPKVVAGRWGP